ncbi:MAG: endonuclease MutS2, partial [Firmicutes bacterium]|nr:endonuclease MutS2 [Bacillota bacterium]
SPALARIRRQIRILGDRVHNELTKIVTGRAKDYLQDALITMRDGRYCIPVKAEHRGDIAGIIHDQSGSGSTLFIEPVSVVNLNNEIRKAELDEEKEIAAILASLSESLAPHIDEIRINEDVLVLLDFIFAKAHLALDMNATRPVVNRDGILDLRRARHPLLPKKKAVPIDLRLGEDFSLLVITGPNTGGKTVTLKTAGLLTLMGQSGLHIPCADRSRIAVFREVFADIGDEQSIEQSLSTFSSHMTNIVSFLAQTDEETLVLFDELGAGTDPTEGAALAIAILSELHSKGVRAIATTHYSELKIYALRTPGIENASCEFDVETLSPTYRLLIGIPGKSNAFAISKKLGLSDTLIEAAKENLSSEAESFEDVISSLEAARKDLEKMRLEAQADRDEIAALKKKLSEERKALAEKKQNLLRSSSEEARNILQNAKDYADRTIRDFMKAQSGGMTVKEMEEKREKLRKKIDNYGTSASQNTVQKKQRGNLSAKDLHVGDRVHVISMDVDATVSTLPDMRDQLYVTAGILRTKVYLSDLVRSDAPPEKPARALSDAGRVLMEKSLTATTEINLIGKTVDEAVAELDKFLDNAVMAHIPEIRIVHGKGTGALRTGIHQYLKRAKHVRSFRLGEIGEGDAGVTIAELK